MSDEIRIRPNGASRRASWCKHYNGTVNKTCAAGVEYQSVRVEHEPVQYRNEREGPKGHIYTQTVSFPCFRLENYGGATCDKCEFRTEEEVMALEAETQRMFQDIALARNAIVASLGGPWKRGMGGSAGAIDCPVCQAKESLKFTRSGYNGHIHAKCATASCVSWME